MLLSLFQILVQYRLFNSLTGLTLVYVVTELPLTIYLLRTFFAQIPTELEEAARLDGCGDWATFWRVMFPMALPAVATTVILNFIYFWNEFLYAVIFITQQKIRTLPLAIQFLVSDQYQDVGMTCERVSSRMGRRKGRHERGGDNPREVSRSDAPGRCGVLSRGARQGIAGR